MKDTDNKKLWKIIQKGHQWVLSFFKKNTLTEPTDFMSARKAFCSDGAKDHLLFLIVCKGQQLSDGRKT